MRARPRVTRATCRGSAHTPSLSLLTRASKGCPIPKPRAPHANGHRGSWQTQDLEETEGSARRQNQRQAGWVEAPRQAKRREANLGGLHISMVGFHRRAYRTGSPPTSKEVAAEMDTVKFKKRSLEGKKPGLERGFQAARPRLQGQSGIVGGGWGGGARVSAGWKVPRMKRTSAVSIPDLTAPF